MVEGTWQEISKRKQAARDALIPGEWRLKSVPGPKVLNVTDVPRTCGILSARELDITENYDATALARAIAHRKLKSVDVTIAYCKQLTNCLTEIMFERAIKRAKALDHHLDQGHPPIGPLHGVPVSLKDMFQVAGVDASLGYSALCFQPSRNTSPLVTLILNAGAVIFCKTNVPQTMMSLDSVNPVFGRTLNPLNRLVTAGGSTGGEGALIALKGSPMGVGTDIGGSIRIPAMCNGLYGFKPSANRIPFSDLVSGHPPGFGKLAIEASAGPMTRSMRDIELFMRTVSDGRPQNLDPSVIPGVYDTLDFSASAGKSKMTVGILSTDGVATPLPPVANILKETAAALKTAGHTVVNLQTPPALGEIQTLCDRLFGPGGNESVVDLIESKGEPIMNWIKPFFGRRGPRTLPETANLHAQRAVVMKTINAALWRDPVTGVEIDAIVCPLSSHPVPPIDSYGGVSYTSSFVLLDYPAGTVPIRSFGQADLSGEVDSGEPLSKFDAHTKAMWSGGFDRKVYLGTPLCVQVIAPRLQEKRCARAMLAIDEAVHAPTMVTSEERLNFNEYAYIVSVSLSPREFNIIMARPVHLHGHDSKCGGTEQATTYLELNRCGCGRCSRGGARPSRGWRRSSSMRRVACRSHGSEEDGRGYERGAGNDTFYVRACGAASDSWDDGTWAAGNDSSNGSVQVVRLQAANVVGKI
ncbi:hypothetical protein FH972_025668 [Carpinus fangiana]|uniref:Amidase domain-containing protein n=1 Tax=Carpinus fangiana TaxID=176857 RepID=A0A5N6L1P0_9ROSI|nr:hypothetical protein FH972_025668 [Carpinus fangiana]